MYDFYPEWGPARHRTDEQERPTRRTRYWQATPVLAGVAAGAPEARDADGERPDDN